MARGLIGKMVRGAAQGLNQAMPLIQENQRAKNQRSLEAMRQDALAKRDAALQEFQAGQTALQMGQAAQFHSEEMGFRQRQEANRQANALVQQGFDGQRMAMLAQQTEQQILTGNLANEEAQRLSDLRSVIVDSVSSPAAKQAASNQITMLAGSNPTKYSAITMYGDENDFGVQSRSSGILNQMTGQITGAQPTSTEAQIQAVMQANPGMTRQRAMNFLLSKGY